MATHPLNRRNFLKTTALGAAYVGLSARSYGQVAGANERMRIGVIGFRSRGAQLIAATKGIKGVEIAGLCDVDSTVLAAGVKKHEGAKGYEDGRRMLEDKNLDAIIVATPNHTHVVYGIWALEAGKNLYVEKPLSHNMWEGRQLVAAAANFPKLIAQAGTQSRSGPGLKAALDYLRSGKLGKIKLARGICYKPRQSIGKAIKQAIPSNINYDLWSGPSDIVDSVRTGSYGPVHYDWHWFWNYGGGDVLNQGVHEVDVARWFLGEDSLAPAVATVGARIGLEDAGETPNTLVTVHAYAAAPLIMEVRGLPKNANEMKLQNFEVKQKDGTTKTESRIPWGMETYKGLGIGIIIECENGSIHIPDYVSATIRDKDGKVIQRYGKSTGTATNLAVAGGEEGHLANWIEAIRNAKSNDLHAPVRECDLSTSLVHASNVAYRVGNEHSQGEIADIIKANSTLAEATARATEHLAKCGFSEAKLRTGALTLDPTTQLFTGPLADKANSDLIAKREGRGAFRIRKYVA